MVHEALEFARRRWAYASVCVPVLTDWVDSGHLPRDPSEYVTEVVVGVLLGVGAHVLHRESDRLRATAETDPLTGIWNRRRFDLDLTREVRRAYRLRQPLSLGFLDVDRFKQINDSLGHERGDEVLKDVARALGHSVRAGVDLCYRLGGDEFAVLFVGAEASAAREALSRWRRHVRSPTVGDVPVELSFGVVQLAHDDSATSLLRRADLAMYEAKGAGRTSVIRARPAVRLPRSR